MKNEKIQGRLDFSKLTLLLVSLIFQHTTKVNIRYYVGFPES